jgi:hypothetical protein
MPKPRLVLKDFHAERKMLSRAYRKTRQPSMRTADDRIVSLIYWNPKTRCYEDHRNSFAFEIRNSWLNIYRLKSNGKREKEPYSSCIARKIFPNRVQKEDILDAGEIKGNAVYVTMIGYTDSADKLTHRQPGHSHRGIMPAIIDYLKRHGATRILLRTDNPQLKKYYADLGFEKDRDFNMLSLTLK